jgi:hypothetical protein
MLLNIHNIYVIFIMILMLYVFLHPQLLYYNPQMRVSYAHLKPYTFIGPPMKQGIHRKGQALKPAEIQGGF